MTDVHVGAVCGSSRDGSHTRTALSIALDAAAERGASTELLDLREWDLPTFDADERDAGEGAAFRERVRAADSIVLGTPVYHGSYSSVLKNALEYCGSDEFDTKTVGLLCTAGGGFPVTALDHLRAVCQSLNAWVVPQQVAIRRASTVFEGDVLTDEAIEDRVMTLGRETVKYASIAPTPANRVRCEVAEADD